MRFPAAIAAAIATNATRFGLDSLLVAAVVMKESSGDPCATKFEKNWRWFTTPIGEACLREQVRGIDGVGDAHEIAMQATSWGLMQVMGAVARELGFRGAYMDDLFVPVVNTGLGCRKLRGLIRQWHDTESALSAYNAGRPTRSNQQAYVEPILAMREGLRQEGGF